MWHLPLACDTAHFSRITVTPADYQKYHSAVSFVGTLYESTYPKLISPLNDYQKGYLDSIELDRVKDFERDLLEYIRG